MLCRSSVASLSGASIALRVLVSCLEPLSDLPLTVRISGSVELDDCF